ncbi:hypothetical protein AN964_05955 [Heyndrickxia shackletonii]|uniref:DUF4355 domain-containing protein n=1 Tax=Heyndrickxia shackletonii TaxID=157838 RepID=A0A0Q3WW34_9BACI|nr:hypothetical protein [Heyndrickxia shackletonii]KQL53098.1 hypothetical protein AN964_05955 [Heyndrickxia shackletonii]NEZ01869.1 hypothetical protein [Heyndrickxia shackletonii]
MAEEISFTQEQLDEAITNAKNEWVEKELNPIVAERDNLLQFKPKDLSDEEKAIQTKQQELIDKEIQLELKSAGLEQFAGVVKVTNTDELKTVIESLNTIVNDIKVSLGYIPDNHKQVTAYDQAKQNGNTKGMIKSLFGLN